MEKMKKFWDLVVNVWTTGFAGSEIGRILIAILIFLCFLVLKRLFIKFVIGRVKKLADRSETELDDYLIESLEKPVGFIPVVIGIFLATEWLGLAGTFADVVEKFVRSLIVFSIFWFFYSLIVPLTSLLKRLEEIFTHSLVDWMIKAIKAAFIFIGVATVLDIWGIKIGPIIAGLGLFGVAVALGAQDLFKNLISGILIIGERRFKRGDWIKVEGVVEGTVEIIGFRSTKIRRFDLAPVYVPNAKLSDNIVINFSAMTFRRIYWMIQLEYRTSVDQLKNIRDRIERYLVETEDFVPPDEAPLFVYIDRFADSSIDVMLYCFTRTISWGEWMEIKQNLAYEIKEIVESEGSGFAFPSRSVYIEPPPDGKPEMFAPPEEGE